MEKLTPIARSLPVRIVNTEPKSAPAVCPICKGLGVLRYEVPADHPRYGHVPWEHPQWGKTKPCQCQASEGVRRAMARTYSWMGINADQVRELDGMTFKSFDPRGNGESVASAYRRARGYAEALRGQVEGQKNGLFLGPYGVGKTHLACAVLNHVRAGGIGCLFVSGNDLFQAIYDSFDEGHKERILQQAIDTPLLCFDDLDKMQLKDDGSYQKTTLFTLFNQRYLAKRPVIITANVDDEWRKWLHPAVLSRLFGKDKVEAIGMQGRDYRMVGGA